jgi:hypothetical protein
VLFCHLLSNALSLSKGALQSWQASFWSLSLWNDDVDKQKNASRGSFTSATFVQDGNEK